MGDVTGASVERRSDYKDAHQGKAPVCRQEAHMWLLSLGMQIRYRTPHTSRRLSLTCSLRLIPALARSLKHSASTSGSPSSPSSGSHPIRAEEILSPQVSKPSPRWFDQLAFDLPLGAWGVSVLGGGWGGVSPGMAAESQL